VGFTNPPTLGHETMKFRPILYDPLHKRDHALFSVCINLDNLATPTARNIKNSGFFLFDSLHEIN
jgi:hypothetical protein